MSKEIVNFNWENIRSNACPKCGDNLKKRNDFYMMCSSENCDFSIGKEKMDKMLAKMEATRTSSNPYRKGI